MIADSNFLPFFNQWFKTQVAEHLDNERVLDEVHLYSATAFEFVAIGAAHMEHRV